MLNVYEAEFQFIVPRPITNACPSHRI